MVRTGSYLSSLALLLVGVRSECFDVSPAFPVPLWQDGASQLSSTFESIEAQLDAVIAKPKYENSSFSVALTSNTDTLWSYDATARRRNESRPGAEVVDQDSVYRIASITKTFTVLGILHQHKAGNLSLDGPISKYVSDLSGEIPWKDITLRILASQLAGIPREFALSDLINEIPDPINFGLPPVSRDSLPKCDAYNDNIPCNRSDLISTINRQKPLYAPNQKSTYSNVAFMLLGLAIENVTGLDYKTYMQQAIFDPLEMSSTTLDTPSDKHAVLPLLRKEVNYWGIEEGVQNPTGGIYSTAADMSKYLRYILTHYNTLATGVNWLMPASWSDGLRNFYGMPWETFRTEKILTDSQRSVVFATKSGGLPGYLTRINLIPEYGLGLTVLTADEEGLLDELMEIITVEVVRAADHVIWKDVASTYDGNYFAVVEGLNSSLSLSSSATRGLVIDSFVSNGTDVLNAVLSQYFADSLDEGTQKYRAQLTPTLLYKDEENQAGEIWRILMLPERSESNTATVWSDFCIADVDILRYAGVPANEVVFWHEEKRVTLSGWNVTLMPHEDDETSGMLFIQDL